MIDALNSLVSSVETQMLDELAALRARVAELEAEAVQLREERDAALSLVSSHESVLRTIGAAHADLPILEAAGHRLALATTSGGTKDGEQ